MTKFDNEFQSVKEKILAAENIAVMTHVNPDGDCLGSGLALVGLINKLGKKATLFNEQGNTEYFRFLISDEEIDKTPECDGRKFDLVIFTDCGDDTRCGKVIWATENADFIINIDHHQTNTMFGGINIVEGTAAATGMIIYYMYRSLGIDIDKHTAELLYMAIATDSGNFSYSSTTKETHYVGGELLECGVDIAYLSQMLFRSTSFNKLKLMSLAFDTLHIYSNGKIAVMQTTREMFDKTGTSTEDSEGLVSYVRDIKGVLVAAFIRDTNEKDVVKVSFRSNGHIDVSKIASVLGGGGHVNAAGCSLKGEIPEVEKIIVDLMSKEIQ